MNEITDGRAATHIRLNEWDGLRRRQRHRRRLRLRARGDAPGTVGRELRDATDVTDEGDSARHDGSVHNGRGVELSGAQQAVCSAYVERGADRSAGAVAERVEVDHVRNARGGNRSSVRQSR